LLELHGRGVRGLSFWHGQYLIVGGHFADGAASLLFGWDGDTTEPRDLDVDLRSFNPEGFFTPEDREQILLLSDDGAVQIEGSACKELKDPRAKRFRGRWLTLPR
jgi:hypothetical protein